MFQQSQRNNFLNRKIQLSSPISFSEFWDEILHGKDRTVYQIKAIKKI